MLAYGYATGFLDFARNDELWTARYDSRLSKTRGIKLDSRPKILALRRLGIETVGDLLNHFPRRHEDRAEFPQFPREESDVPICLCGEVTKTSLRRFGGWKKIFEATLEESEPNALSEPLVCRFFNLHYVQKMIATGQRLVVWQAASARKADLHGSPGVRGDRE